MEMPLMKPMRTGRDRKLAITPSLSRLARTQSRPTMTATAAAMTTFCEAVVWPSEASTAASTMVVPASGPTIT